MAEASRSGAHGLPGPSSAVDASSLFEWWGRHRRELPWRRTRDPWAVLVSEVMLQQTQVARVLARFGPFLERFPTVAACAAATPADVIAAWAGLGYNRRALALHRCAAAVVERHRGSFPATLDHLLALPGVGPYTARALLAFAFARDVAVVDTNVARVLARRAGRPLSAREVQAAADEAVPPGEGWAWNQALLDFGALVCTKRAPRCEACPVREGCAWGAVPTQELVAVGGDRYDRLRQGHDGGGILADPAASTALTSGRQSRFEGSDRQGRGRLVDALRAGPVAATDLPAVMGWPTDPARAGRVAATLCADGLAAPDGHGTWHLAGR